jgi:hypothetical protein
MKRRVLRGGSVIDVARDQGLGHDTNEPEVRYGDIGFRIVVKRRKP